MYNMIMHLASFCYTVLRSIPVPRVLPLVKLADWLTMCHVAKTAVGTLHKSKDEHMPRTVTTVTTVTIRLATYVNF